MAELQFAVQAYQAHSLGLDAQRAVNVFAEMGPASGKTKIPVWGCAGLVAFATCGNGPIWGLHVMNDVLYAVSGQALYQINPDGSSVLLGTTLVTGPVCMDDNGVELCWVDGKTGWYYSTSDGVTQIVDDNFYPADVVVFFDGYFVFNRSGTKEFFLSPIYGVTPFDGTLFASKEATPDLLVSIVNTHEELLLFGQKRCEVWYDAGNATPEFPFQRYDGAFIQRGIAGPHAKCLEDNTVFFLGEDGVFYRLDGLQPVRVSTHAMEKAWQTYPTMKSARVFSFTTQGHKMVVLLFPEAPATWVYDVSTQLWHERESWLGDNEDSSIGRWRANTAIMAYDRILIGDSRSGAIGQMNYAISTEFGCTMRALVTAPPLHEDRARIFLKRFEVDVESGVGIAGSTTETYETVFQVNPWCLGGAENGVTTTPALPSGFIVNAEPFTVRAPGPSGFPAAYPYLLFSVWLEFPDTTQAVWMTFRDPTTGYNGQGLSLTLSLGSITVSLADAAGTTIGAGIYQPPASLAGQWVNILISADSVGQRMQCYVNDVVCPYGEGMTAPTWNSSAEMGVNDDALLLISTSDYAETDFCMAQLYAAAPAEFFDLTVTANRRKFISDLGYPVTLGDNGGRPTGAQPALFLSLGLADNAADAVTNLGTGSSFTVTTTTEINGVTYTYVPPALQQCPGGLWPPAGTGDAVTITQAGNSPQGSDPQIMLDWSDDGARTWSKLVKWRSMGRAGEYLKRLRWLKMGWSRQRILRLRITDPVRRNLIGFYIDVSKGME